MGRRWTTGVLAAVLVGGLALPAVAVAAPTATLSIKAAPRPVLSHEVVTVSGHLTPVRGGRAVKLQRLSGRTWVTLGVAHTNARSNYSVRTRAPLSGHEVLRALLVAADGSPVVSGSLTLAPVRPTISVGGVSWVRTGGVVHASGTFSPARPGRKVTLQRKAGATWVTLATGRLDGHSRYAVNGRVTVGPGAASLRVVASALNGAPAAASAVHVLVVTGNPPALTGPVDAIYVGLKASSTPGSYSPVAGGAVLALTDGGRVTSAVPADGPQVGTELAASARTGVYAAHDGVIDVAWETDGSTATLRQNSKGQLVMNGVPYGIVDPLNGATLSGVYRRASGGSGSTITFHGNGRFDDEGVTGDTSLVGTDNPSGTGSYSVQGNTLSLVYDAGPFETLAVYALPQWLGSKAQLVLGGQTFKRLTS